MATAEQQAQWDFIRNTQNRQFEHDRYMAEEAQKQREEDNRQEALRRAEEAEQERSFQAELQAREHEMRERELELSKTENCLVCGTPVSTGRGSGLWLEGVQFPGEDLPALLSTVRSLLEWKRKLMDEKKYISDELNAATAKENWNEQHLLLSIQKLLSWEGKLQEEKRGIPNDSLVKFRDKLQAATAKYGQITFSLEDWTRFEERAKVFLADRESSMYSQRPIGPYCCKKCADEAFATDPEIKKAQEDRERIAFEWEQLSAEPVLAAACSAVTNFPAEKVAYAKLYKQKWETFLASPEGQSYKAEIDAVAKATVAARRAKRNAEKDERMAAVAAQRAERRQKGLVVQEPKQKKAFFICLAIPFVWFIVTGFSKEDFWVAASASFSVFFWIYIRSIINFFYTKKDNGCYASKWILYGCICCAIASLMTLE